MFRSARWRSEKNKIKAVFKLQFHATQVTQVGIDALMISVIPIDIGKPTAKLEKVVVQDGSCYWETPVYETVKFDRETKSGKIHERIYRFVVGTGSAKAGVVGEASIDFSSYAEATKLSSVSLPLKNSKSEILLHVSIQRVQDSEDQRAIAESETPKDNFQDRSLRAQLSNGEMGGSILSNSNENGMLNTKTAQNGDFGKRRTSSGSDVTLSSSDSSSGLDTPREVQLIHASGPRGPTNDIPTTISDEHQRSKWEWLGGSAVELSTDDSSSTPSEVLQQMTSLVASDDVVEKLKSELIAMARQAEVSELELQTLRKQIVKESKKGQDLSREVISLKKERDSFKEECEKLKSVKAKNMLQIEGGDLKALVEELRQELNYEKDLNANLRIQLQKTQESNSELILAVRDLDELLEQKNHLPDKSATDDDAGKLQQANSKCEKEDAEDDEEQKALEQIVKDHSDAKEIYVMEQKIIDLESEIEIYRREKDELEVQMEQIALDYEILKQENHEMSYKLEQSRLQEQLKMQYECTSSYADVNELESQIQNLENELKKQEKEFSKSSNTIRELETHVKELEEELEKQAQGFEADLETLTCAKVEQEKRAIQAEETLRKTRSQNASTAQRIQEEFRRLSSQMASTFEANEKLATKALMEANELRLHKSHLEEMLEKANEEIDSVKDHYEARVYELSGQVISLSKQIELLQLEIEEQSLKLGNQEKFIEELKADIETLSTQNKSLSELADRKETLTVELECMRKSIKEMEQLIVQGNNERIELESRVAVVKKEAEESLKELNRMRSLEHEKELIHANLQAEADTLKAQRDELKRSSYEDELEKEQLKKQVIQLKSDLKKKEDALKSLEKKLKDGNGFKPTPKTNKSPTVPYGPKEVSNLKEKIRLLEGQIKLKEAALETSTNSFLEKEKDLQNKIEELEETLEVLHQNSVSFCQNIPEKVPIKDDVNPIVTEEVRDEVMSRDTDELLNEMTLLKEKNKLMEDDLKEMQERYSEISLKFAEVEGERQQLVMRVRNLKNAKRSS